MTSDDIIYLKRDNIKSRLEFILSHIENAKGTLNKWDYEYKALENSIELIEDFIEYIDSQ